MVDYEKTALPHRFISKISSRQADVLNMVFRTPFGKIGRTIFSPYIMRAKYEAATLPISETRVAGHWGIGKMLARALINYLETVGITLSPWKHLYGVFTIKSTYLRGPKVLSTEVIENRSAELDHLIHITTRSLDYENATGVYEIELENWKGSGKISQELETVLNRLEYQRGPIYFGRLVHLDVGAHWYPQPIWVATYKVAAPITPYHVTKAITSMLPSELSAKMTDLVSQSQQSVARSSAYYELSFPIVIRPSETLQRAIRQSTKHFNQKIMDMAKLYFRRK